MTQDEYNTWARLTREIIDMCPDKIEMSDKVFARPEHDGVLFIDEWELTSWIHVNDIVSHIEAMP